ncbi:MAG: branched-chain amino acid transporter AzlC [Ruminococcaceae bacterium]|nr:branched-chain amino acid transporter AzlC [Oscillospiraceae bacterium]
MKKKAFLAAFPHTIPIFVGFLFVGVSYGLLMKSQGFPLIYPLMMGIIIFAGSMQFVTVGLLLAPFNPVYAFFLTLMVNARHLFYGVSLLDKYRDTGWMKPYLIYGLIDESFSLNCAVSAPEGVDQNWFIFFISLLNHIYWLFGSCLGSVLGDLIHINTTGIDFVMTALFVVLFINQWKEADDHRPALAGVGCTVLSLFVFGSERFMLPAMGGIVIFFLWLMRKEAKA